MADQFQTMADIAKMNGSDRQIGLIEEVITASPEAMVFPTRVIKGVKFDTLKRVTLPGGGFRKPNTGVATTASTYTNEQVECAYYDAQMRIDNAVATSNNMGVADSLATEESGHLQTFLNTIGKQIWYGTGNNANGFPGAIQLVDAGMVYDAAGTVEDTCSSVWLVALGPRKAELILGNETLWQTGLWRKQTETLADSTKQTAWVNSLEGWNGMAWYTKFSLARIKKLTGEAGHTLTDAILAEGMALFPQGTRPTHIFMTTRSRLQLQKSRTVTLFGQGVVRPDGSLTTIAPVPTEYDGVPIVRTDNLNNIEKLAA